jgi:hypothetical protein
VLGLFRLRFLLQRLEAFLSNKAMPACTCLRLIDTIRGHMDAGEPHLERIATRGHHN